MNQPRTFQDLLKKMGAVEIPDFTERLVEAQREAEEERERREHLLNQPFKLKVSTCACGGRVVFNFKGKVPVGRVKLGGPPGPTREEYQLACAKCGGSFDRNHPPIAEAIQKYRDRLLVKSKPARPRSLAGAVEKEQAVYRKINRKGSSARGLSEAHVGTMLDSIDDLEGQSKPVPRITGGIRKRLC